MPCHAMLCFASNGNLVINLYKGLLLDDFLNFFLSQLLVAIYFKPTKSSILLKILSKQKNKQQNVPSSTGPISPLSMELSAVT